MMFHAHERLGIHPRMIIMIISWPPLASLTSNLTSPIFKGNFPHELCMPNVGFDKNTNEVKANSNVKLVKKLEFAVESVKKPLHSGQK